MNFGDGVVPDNTPTRSQALKALGMNNAQLKAFQKGSQKGQPSPDDPKGKGKGKKGSRVVQELENPCPQDLRVIRTQGYPWLP